MCTLIRLPDGGNVLHVIAAGTNNTPKKIKQDVTIAGE